MSDLRTALYYLVGLVVAFVAHEYAQALAASRFGDDGARRQGRMSLNPMIHADPLGTYILPALLLLLVAAGKPFVPPFAYGKPMPLESQRMRKPDRDYILTLLAGPAATLVLAVLGALGLKAVGLGEPGIFLARVMVVSVMMTVFQLMPIPPLDGSKILARFLPPKAGLVMDQMQVYGGLFMIAIFFIFGAPVLAIVEGLGNGLCRLLVGFPCL